MTSYARWRPEFAKAMDGMLYGPEYLDYLFRIGAAFLFSTATAAIVVRFEYYPGPTGHGDTIKVIEGLIAAGDLEEIVNVLIPAAEAWGKSQDCAFAMIASREGWLRVLRGQGYSAHQVTLIKEL